MSQDESLARPTATELDILRILWAGQSAADDSAGAERAVDWAATTVRRTLSNILQILYESKPGESTWRRFGLSWTVSSDANRLQSGVTASPSLDLFQTARRGAPASLDGASQHNLVLSFDASSLWAGLGRSDHRLDYGLQARLATGAYTREVPGNVQLLYEGSQAVEAALFSGPFRFQASRFNAEAYLQDTITFFDFIVLRAGLNADWTLGWNGTSNIRWLTLSPRAELTIPLSAHRASALKIEGGRYALQLPLNYLTWGNPLAPGASIYGWTDSNKNGTLDAGELGPLQRKDGPAFSTIDPSLRRPYLDEFMLSFIQDLGAGWRLTLSGFLRQTHDLIAVTNVGVTSADYTARTFEDIGDDRIFGDQDDMIFTVWDRHAAALGRDAFFLTNADAANRVSTYKGLDLTLARTWNDRFFLYAALTAMEIVGTTNPGNTEWQNDDGVLGSLYTDPNNAINARGRMRFDRAYTVRIGGSLALPLGTRLSVLAKYYDGQPFTRLIIVDGLAQGPLFIQAHPRGVATSTACRFRTRRRRSRRPSSARFGTGSASWPTCSTSSTRTRPSRKAPGRTPNSRSASPRVSSRRGLSGPASTSSSKETAMLTPIDVVITVCDNAAGEICPIWPGHPATAHWGIDDPAHVEPMEARKAAFEVAFAALEKRIKAFLALELESMTRQEVIAAARLIHEACQ